MRMSNFSLAWYGKESQEMLRRRITLAAAAATLAASLMAPGCSTANVQSASSKAEAPAAAVSVATVTRKDAPVEVRAIGNVEAYSTISVKAQIGGELTRVYFGEGDSVRKGDPLFE